MMAKRTATFLMIAVVAVVTLVVLFFINKPLIFQEGNPILVFKGIYHLVIKNEPYCQFKGSPATFITRSDERFDEHGQLVVVSRHDYLFKLIEDSYGVTLANQSKDTYTFTGSGKTITLKTRLYSRSFQVWQVCGP